MTDWDKPAATGDAFEDPSADAAERGIDHLKAIAADLFEAGRSAAQSVLDEQKATAARQVAAVAAAVRAAAQSLDHADLPTLAHQADQAAGTIESFGQALGGRRWSELADDLEILARRRPALFLTAAALAGFLAGRLLRASDGRAAAGRGDRIAPAATIGVARAPASGAADRAAPAAGLAGTRDILP